MRGGPVEEEVREGVTCNSQAVGAAVGIQAEVRRYVKLEHYLLSPGFLVVFFYDTVDTFHPLPTPVLG